MKKQVGLWIDHREAIIVTMTNEGEEIQRIQSDAESRDQQTSSAPSGSPEDRRDRRFGDSLKRYYTDVIKAIHDADSILILGPGEAKGELEKSLAQENLSDQIVDVKPADKLTEPQIVAQVRDYFAK